MRTTRLITTLLAAALTAALVAGPAAAVPADTPSQPNGSYVSKPTIQGSMRSEPATANVYVPPAGLGLGDGTTPAAGPPTWPTNPQPSTRRHAVVAAQASGFDWGSAGAGAAAALGACVITLAAIVGVRRRIARPRSLTTH
jgi:hypothetical protein